jgi:hypothetical protein
MINGKRLSTEISVFIQKQVMIGLIYLIKDVICVRTHFYWSFFLDSLLLALLNQIL